jgi:hypothetical protein
MGPLPEPAAEEAVGYGPETITLYLSAEEEDGSRSAAGLTESRIRMTSVMNFVQIIFRDAESGQITSMAEVRKKQTGDTVGGVEVKHLKRGRTYHVLVLQGHWTYTAITNNEYVYDANLPTLLAAGYSSGHTIPATGSLPVSIDLDPIWIDTKFTTSFPGVPAGLASVEPYIDPAAPGTVGTTGLVPVGNWNAAFTVYRKDAALTTENGFADLLAAQAAGSELTLQETSPVLWIKGPSAGSTLLEITNPGTLSRGSGTDNHIFTYTIPADYTHGCGRLGTEGYVNFNLKYIPFAKTTAADWQSGGQYLSSFFIVPQWIIRNGVNDKPQNVYTNFEDTGLLSGNPDTGLNWNGAVPFTVALVQSGSNPDPNFPTYSPPMIAITDGEWGSPIPGDGVDAPIKFNTLGDFTAANWYYVVPSSSGTPPISEFLANPGSGPIDGPSSVKLTRTVTIPTYDSTKKYDVWVVAVKDYVISQPYLIAMEGGGFKFEHEWAK